MNPGNPSPGDAIFLVTCADDKCLAIQDTKGKGKSFYDETELPDVAEVVSSVALELVLPFLLNFNRQRLCPIQMPVQR